MLIDISKEKGNYTIVVSLGLQGRLNFTSGNIYFDIGIVETKGSFNIMRKTYKFYFYSGHCGKIVATPTDNLEKFLFPIGPDVLQAALSETTWITSNDWNIIFTQKKIAKWCICKALMDQQLVAGIGNYLKSEILYYSGILPQRLMNTLTKEEMERIRVVAHKIILLSYVMGSNGGYNKVVYNKEFDTYGNKVVSGKTSDGRTSYWVTEFQI